MTLAPAPRFQAHIPTRGSATAKMSVSPRPTSDRGFGRIRRLRAFAGKADNIVHWSEAPSDGRFAVLERRELTLADPRAFVPAVSGEQR